MTNAEYFKGRPQDAYDAFEKSELKDDLITIDKRKELDQYGNEIATYARSSLECTFAFWLCQEHCDTINPKDIE